MALQRSQPRAGLLVLVAPAAWGVARVVRAALVVRRAGPAARVVSAALPVVRVDLEVLVAVLLVAAMVALAGSAAIHVAVPVPLAVGLAAIAPAAVVRGPALDHRDRADPHRALRAHRAVASAVRSARVSVNRIGLRVGLDPAVLAPAALDRRRPRPIEKMNPSARAPTVGPRDASRGGRTPCRRLNSGH